MAVPPDEHSACLQVISAAGTVFGKVHGTGHLEAEPIATIGVGALGLICNAAGGSVPVEARDGQQARIPALGAELRPVSIIRKGGPAAPGQTTAPATPGQTTGAPAGSTPPVAATETSALYVETGDAAAKPGNVVTASLILSQSAPDPLVVPSSALWTRDGQTLVTVQGDSGSRDVPVVVAFSAGGENAVSAAAQASPLAVGDKVVVAGAR